MSTLPPKPLQEQPRFLAAARARMEELGMPPGAAWVYIRTVEPLCKDETWVRFETIIPFYGFGELATSTQVKAGRLQRWHGLRYEGFGLAIHDVPHPHPWPSWRLTDHRTGHTLHVQLWWQRATYDRAPVFAELHWRPEYEYGRAAEIGPEPLSGRAEKLAYRALRFLRIFPALGRLPEDADVARRRLLTAALELKQRYCKIDRDGLAGWVPGVGSVDGIAVLLDRAGWGVNALRAIAQEAHPIRRTQGLALEAAVSLAEACNWDLQSLKESTTKTHTTLREGG